MTIFFGVPIDICSQPTFLPGEVCQDFLQAREGVQVKGRVGGLVGDRLLSLWGSYLEPSIIL